MRKILLLGATMCALVLAGAGPAAADSSTYQASQNVYVPVYTSPAVAAILYRLNGATLTFSTQEAAQQYAADHGAGISHSYIVVMVNGQAVLYIDPPCYFPEGGGSI